MDVAEDAAVVSKDDAGAVQQPSVASAARASVVSVAFDAGDETEPTNSQQPVSTTTPSATTACVHAGSAQHGAGDPKDPARESEVFPMHDGARSSVVPLSPEQQRKSSVDTGADRRGSAAGPAPLKRLTERSLAGDEFYERFAGIEQTMAGFGDSFQRHPTFKYVGIRVEIFRIYDIDAAGSNFKCDFEVFLEWDDPTLVDVLPTGKNAGCTDPRGGWEPLWYPPVRFHNQYERLYQWCNKYYISDVAKGRVSAKLGFRGPFYDVMDLRRFPFDRQVLHIVIACDEPISQMEYCKHPANKPNSILLEELAEWKLDNSFSVENKSDVVEPTMYHDVLGDSTRGFQRYIVQIRVQRRYMYFVWNVGVYMFVISLLGMTSFAVDPNDVGDRLEIMLTLVLSIIAFKFAIAGLLPYVPYLTVLDEYLILSFSLIAVLAAENAFVGGLDISDDKRALVDKCFYFAYGATIIAGNVLIVVLAAKGYFFDNWDVLEASDETRHAPGATAEVADITETVPDDRGLPSRNSFSGRRMSSDSVWGDRVKLRRPSADATPSPAKRNKKKSSLAAMGKRNAVAPRSSSQAGQPRQKSIIGAR